ncbi:MAG: hypothetical protein WC644_12460 [Ignavibacteria bacterium]
MKRYIKLILGTFIILIIASTLWDTLRIKASASNLDFQISVEKNTFLKGEEFDIIFSITNVGSKIDSVQNFNEVTLSSDAEISSDKKPTLPYGGMPALDLPLYYNKIQPNEKISDDVPLQFYRGDDGVSLYSYFSNGKYKVRGVCKDGLGQTIKSNTIEFEIIEPEGIEKQAFEDFSYIVYYEKKYIKNRARNQEDRVILVDKAIEFLYKYPTSVYTGRILSLSFLVRESGKYKFDESFLNDIEFFLEKNPKSRYLKTLISNTTAYFWSVPNGKEKAIEHFNTLKQKLNNSSVDELIEEQYQKNELFKENIR